jgi:hypothetical protein
MKRVWCVTFKLVSVFVVDATLSVEDGDNEEACLEVALLLGLFHH